MHMYVLCINSLRNQIFSVKSQTSQLKTFKTRLEYFHGYTEFEFEANWS